MRSIPGGIVGGGVRRLADGGLLLTGTVMHRLGLEAMVDETVRLDGRVAGSGSGRKVLTLVASMLVGGCCIDDVERLRAGASQAVLPFRVVAPSTAGSFLRSFTFGHVRQLDKAAELALARAWSVGAAPSVAEMTLDLDSTVCEVCGRAKHGAAYGHTKVLGYHPLVAVRSDTGEVLHSRMRSGSSQRGNEHFARETLARVRRLGAHAAVTVRADAGFFSYDMIAAIGAHGASYSITIPQNAKVKAAAAAIVEDAWRRSPTPAAARPRWLRPPSKPAAAATSCAAPTPSPPSCAWSYAAAACSAPRASCGPTGATTASSPTDTTSTPKPPTQTIAATPQSSSPSETSKKAPGSAAAPQDSSPPTAPGSPAACSLTTSPAGWPRAHPPRAPTHRRGHHPQPAPHRAGPPRQPQRPPQTAPAAQLALGKHLHHRPATNPQPPPAHLSRPQRPAQRTPTPPATNPHQPRTPILHAPKRAGPHTRTSPAATRPQPPIPQARRWIQANNRVLAHGSMLVRSLLAELCNALC